MHNERQVSLFRNGRSQAIRIPRDFELEGTKAVIRKEGDKLIIEPVRKKSLKELLAIFQCWMRIFPKWLIRLSNLKIFSKMGDFRYLLDTNIVLELVKNPQGRLAEKMLTSG